MPYGQCALIHNRLKALVGITLGIAGCDLPESPGPAQIAAMSAIQSCPPGGDLVLPMEKFLQLIRTTRLSQALEFGKTEFWALEMT